MRIQANQRTNGFEVGKERLFKTIERMNESIERAVLAFADAHARQRTAAREEARRTAAERAAMILEARSMLEVPDGATPAQIRSVLTRKLEMSRNDVRAIVLNGAAAMVLLAGSETASIGDRL